MRLDAYQSDLDRGAACWKEALWILVKIPFFLFPLPLPNCLRVGILRAFGARLGKGLVIRSGVDISFPWRLSADDHVWIGERARLLTLGPISIGSHVCISQEAFLCTGSHDYSSLHFNLIVKQIALGDGCWIGARAFIGPGVTVASGAIVAACAVVMKDIAAGTIVVGNPAVEIKKHPLG